MNIPIAPASAGGQDSLARGRSPDGWPPPRSPERTVTGFYAAYVRLHPSGIPGPRVKRGLERFLSQRLNKLLTDADRAEAQYAITTKNEVPPLVEGDLFS